MRYPAPRTVRISCGLLGHRLELLAQMADVDVDGARVAVGAVAPDRAQQVVAAVDALAIAHQRVQQLELRERQRDRPAVTLDLARPGVERERPDAERRLDAVAAARRAAAPRGCGCAARPAGTA